MIDELSFDEPKTKRAAELLVVARAERQGRCVVLAQPTEDGAVEKSFRNLRDVSVAYAGGLGTYDLLWADRVLFTPTPGRSRPGHEAGRAPKRRQGRDERR